MQIGISPPELLTPVLIYFTIYCPLAQLVEHRTLTAGVAGSNPAGTAKFACVQQTYFNQTSKVRN